MKGSYHVIVQNRYLKYEFDIKRNFTLIQGNSATGKTTLVEMLRDAHLNKNSGVTIVCDCQCRVIEGDLWKEQIAYITNSIIFIDEGSSFVETEDFAIAAKNSSNYFVIVTRESLEMLPISVEEVYGIHSSGKFGKLEPVYHELYRIYDTAAEKTFPVTPGLLLVEDSNSGFDFWSDVATKGGITCFSANGKSNIFAFLSEMKSDEEILVIADGAAFASQMRRVSFLANRNANIHLYLPESFEWLLLNAGIVQNSELHKILDNPCDYIESAEYFSWERFFTALLIEKTTGTFLQYSKNKLNSNYCQKSIQDKILSEVKGVMISS